MRRHIQNKIKIIGMFKWNTNPANKNKELIVSRRPNSKLNKNATDYLICPNCIGLYAITNLRNHFTSCTGGAYKSVRNVKILSRAIEGRFAAEASDQLREVIPVMREDAVVQLIRYDPLLIVYGNLLCLKYHFHFQQNMIRAKLRLAGRVLQAVRIINAEVTDFASLYHPKLYKQVIEAIKVVGKFNSVTNEFGAPATSASAVTLVKQIGSVLKCEYIEAEDCIHVKKTEDFLYLMESQFTSVISKRVKESQQQKRREKNHKIPSKNDVRLLSAFLNSERKTCFDGITANFSTENWVKLLELTLASIIVFNRRRVGEAQNILTSNFLRRESIETSNEELFGSLSEEAKKVARRYTRMKIRGKKGSNVNVLLKADISSCLELLLNYRERAGVSPSNPFLFALPSSPFDTRIKVVNACRVLATISVQCGAEDPSTLRGTNLRKHLATTCMAMELNDDMVSELAKFMGHAESVHREYYRHNTIDREVVKIANLLEAAQGIDQDFDDSVSDDDDSLSDDDDSEYVVVPESTLQAISRNRNNINGEGRKKLKAKTNPKKESSSVAGAKSTSQAARKGIKANKKEHTKRKSRAATVHSSMSDFDPNSAKSTTINPKKKSPSVVGSTKQANGKENQKMKIRSATVHYSDSGRKAAQSTLRHMGSIKAKKINAK